MSYEEIMKPRIYTCGNCGGQLHIIPFEKNLGNGRITIDTMNICGKCSFKESEVLKSG